jgi:hypothetical protein
MCGNSPDTCPVCLLTPLCCAGNTRGCTSATSHDRIASRHHPRKAPCLTQHPPSPMKHIYEKKRNLLTSSTSFAISSGPKSASQTSSSSTSTTNLLHTGDLEKDEKYHSTHLDSLMIGVEFPSGRGVRWLCGFMAMSRSGNSAPTQNE